MYKKNATKPMIGSSAVLRVTFGLVETIVFLHLAINAERMSPCNYMFFPIPTVSLLTDGFKFRL
jgi:hypothetical protein